jgi:hypothetical protein
LSGTLGTGRSGAALGIGALAGALVSVPALLRLTAAGVDGVTSGLVLAGGSALLLGPLLVLLGSVRPGVALAFPLAGLGLAAWPLARFGQVLEATTHHRPLGAATFAIGALAVVLGCQLVAWRVRSLTRDGAWRAPALVFFAAAVASSGAVLLTALRSDGTAVHVLDAVLLIVGAALGWWALLRPRVTTATAVPARAGVVFWAVLVAGYLWGVTRPAFDQVCEGARVLSGIAGWL